MANIYLSGRLRWVEIVESMGERSVQGLMGGKPEGRRPLGRSRHKWDDNIEMDLGEVGWGSVDWVDVAQARDRWRAFAKAVMNLRVP
jgi:hypothetical protein